MTRFEGLKEGNYQIFFTELETFDCKIIHSEMLTVLDIRLCHLRRTFFKQGQQKILRSPDVDVPVTEILDDKKPY